MEIRAGQNHADSRSIAKLFIIIVVGVFVVINVRSLWMTTEQADYDQLNKTTWDFDYDQEDAANVDEYDDGSWKLSDDHDLIGASDNSNLILEDGSHYQSLRSVHEPSESSEGDGFDGSEESKGTNNSRASERDRIKCLILVNFLKNEPGNGDLIDSLIHVHFLEYSTTTQSISKQYLIHVKILNYEPSNEDPMKGVITVKFFSPKLNRKEAKVCSMPIKFLGKDENHMQALIQAKYLPPLLTNKEHIHGCRSIQGRNNVQSSPSRSATVEPIQSSSVVKLLSSDATTVNPQEDEFNFDKWPFLNEHITWDSMQESTVAYASGQSNGNIPDSPQLSQQGGPGNDDIPDSPQLSQQGGPGNDEIPDSPQLSQQGGPGNDDIPDSPQLSQQGGPGNDDIPDSPQLSQQGGPGNDDIPNSPQLSQKGGPGNDDIPDSPQLSQHRCQGNTTKECVFSSITGRVIDTENITAINEILKSNCHQVAYIAEGGKTSGRTPEATTVYYCTVDDKLAYRNKPHTVMGVVWDLVCCYILELALLSAYQPTFWTDYSNVTVWRLLWEATIFWCTDVLVLTVFLFA